MAVVQRDKKWIADFYDLNGKRVRKVCRNKALAEKFERNALAKRDNNELFGVDFVEIVTVSELIEKYKEYSHTHKKAGTVEIESYYLKYFEDFFKDKYASDITTKDIDDYKMLRSKTLKNSSINRELCVLKNMLQKAEEWGHIKAVPKSKMLKNPPGRIRYLSEDEYHRLLNATTKDYTKHAIKFALLSGMRKGEILGLEIKGNIDLINKIIHINDSKSGERRDIPISEGLGVLTEEIKGERKSGKLFNGGDFKKGFQASVKRAGIEDFHFHDLRHTFASWLAIDGVSLFVIKELLGHKKIEMTMRYAHLSPDCRAEAVNVLSNKIKILTRS